MAAKTASKITPQPQCGDGFNVFKVSFADIDNADTWSSTLAQAIQYVGCLTAGVSTKFSGSTVTFATDSDNLALDLMVVTN